MDHGKNDFFLGMNVMKKTAFWDFLKPVNSAINYKALYVNYHRSNGLYGIDVTQI